MSREHQQKIHLLQSLAPPDSFYERIIQDIPVAAWVKLLQREPALHEIFKGGFSANPQKLARHLQRPELQARLRRWLRTEAGVLDAVLELWGQEKLDTMAYLEMLSPEFICENLQALKNLLGPERFCAGLYLLDLLQDNRIGEAISAGYWERRVEADIMEPLLPFLILWQDVLREHPQATDWTKDALPQPAPAASALPATTPPSQGSEQEARHLARSEAERRRKVEQKLAKLKEENQQLLDQTRRTRQDNEDLRRRAAQWQQDFDRRLQAALDEQRLAWSARYREVDEAPLEDVRQRLEGLLRRADRAFALQREADEQYGLLATVTQQLLQLELYLKEIERVYADSLVVHPEVAKVKNALLQERTRIRNLPGLERILRAEPSLAITGSLQQKLHLLEPLPENLPRVLQWGELLKGLADTELLDDDLTKLGEALEHKQRQILETLYARFQSGFEPRQRQQLFRSLDDLVRSGEGKSYDLFVDGYNILLRVQSAGSGVAGASFTAMREQFIAAVVRKSRLFHKITLVCDGVEESRDRQGNVELLYADKTRGQSADAVIIRALQQRKDKLTLLVTADREIIDATVNHLYAVVDPYHFYTFIFNLDLPPLDLSHKNA
jgi:hypothetical protein